MTQSQIDVGQSIAKQWLVIDVKEGGMGLVYLCRSTETGSMRAIKTVRMLQGPTGEEFRRRFAAEVKSWIVLSDKTTHENVVQALHYDAAENHLFLEYVEGLPLTATAPPKTPVHPTHATDWALGVAKGMQILHREFQLVHRDLKPDNILITQKGLVPKITDLGIAKVVQEEAAQGTIAGTRGYMAPETYEGVADFRSDVWCYAAVVYRMLTGYAPFRKKYPTPTTRPEEPGHVNSSVAPAVNDLVMKCLEFEPSARCQTFDEIIPVVESLPTLASQWDESRFRFCSHHGFHSPVSDNLPDCLFCDYAYQFQVSLEKATHISQSPRPPREGSSDSSGEFFESDGVTHTGAGLPSGRGSGSEDEDEGEVTAATIALAEKDKPKAARKDAVPTRTEGESGGRVTVGDRKRVRPAWLIPVAIGGPAVGLVVVVAIIVGIIKGGGVSLPEPGTGEDPTPGVILRGERNLELELLVEGGEALVGFAGDGDPLPGRTVSLGVQGPETELEQLPLTGRVSVPAEIVGGQARSGTASSAIGSLPVAFEVQGQEPAGALSKWQRLDVKVSLASLPDGWDAGEPVEIRLVRRAALELRGLGSDVTVSLDGRELSPGRELVTPGSLRLTARRPGYQNRSLDVVAKAGRVEIVDAERLGVWVERSPEMGARTVTITLALTAGSMVSFADGARTQETRQATVTLEGPESVIADYPKSVSLGIPDAILAGTSRQEIGRSGRLQLEFRVTGHEPRAQSLASWDRLSIAMTPTRLPDGCESGGAVALELLRRAALEVVNAPTDARVFVGDRALDPGVQVLPSGDVTLRVSRDGYPDKNVTVTLVPGRVKTIEFDEFGGWESARELIARARRVCGTLDAWRAASPQERQTCAEAVASAMAGFSFQKLDLDDSGLAILTLSRPELRSGIDFVLIPGGEFVMGAVDGDPNALSDENPATGTSVGPFLMARTEVTRSVWSQVLGGPAVPESESTLPYVKASWSDADDLVRRLGLLLPTERQWEYACRGGTRTIYSFGDDARELEKHSVRGSAPAPVGSKIANSFGLFDLHGNAAEWCRDPITPSITELLARYESGSDGDPQAKRVVRGGHFRSPPKRVRASWRDRLDPGDRSQQTGVRLVAELPQIP